MPRLEFIGRTCRPFSFWPKIFGPVNENRTSLLQILWWVWVIVPDDY